jgi:hypothetical protein
MPPQDPIQNPEVQGPQNTATSFAHRSPWHYILYVIAATLSVFLLIWLFVMAPNASSPNQRPNLVPAELTTSTQEGDYANAVAVTQGILNDPNRSVEEKALAVYNYMGARYRVSGDMSDRLLDIQDIKPVILNPAVSAQTRADSLAALAGQYASSGRDPSVLAEIFKDAPFSTYLIPGDPDASIRRLFEWSYEILPTSYTVVSIAQWHAMQGVLNPDLEQATRESYTKLAVEKLAEADQLSLREANREPRYMEGLKYLLFRTSRTVTIGGLAIQNVEPHASNYREEFDSYIAFALSSEHIFAKGLLLSVRLTYALALARDNDTAAAKVQLDQLAQEMKASQNPGVSNFILTLRTQSEYESDSSRWLQLEELFEISPNFKAAVDTAVTAGQR